MMPYMRRFDKNIVNGHLFRMIYILWAFISLGYFIGILQNILTCFKSLEMRYWTRREPSRTFQNHNYVSPGCQD